MRMMKRLICLMLLCLFPAMAACETAENKYDLPVDIDAGGYTPNPACYSKDGYADDSLTVRAEVRDVDGVRYDIVWVTVKSPTQLRTAVAGKPNSLTTMLPTKMAKAKNAVAAINGEFYVQRTRDVLIYRQGVMFRNEADPKKDVLVIDDKGDFYVFTSENKAKDIEEFVNQGGVIINAFSFGPALVIDGQAVKISDDYYFNCTDRLPRSVIGQVGPLSYVFVEAEGRVRWSKGNTHQKMADFMASLGVRTAYNLDGGQSCVVIFNGKYLDDKTRNTERSQSDIIYVVSAVDPATWQ